MQTKAQQMIEEILETMDCEPLRILADVANGKSLRCGVGLNKAGDDLVEDDVIPSMDQRITACKELLQYIYPKKKAVDHTGNVNLLGIAETIEKARRRASDG